MLEAASISARAVRWPPDRGRPVRPAPWRLGPVLWFVDPVRRLVGPVLPAMGRVVAVFAAVMIMPAAGQEEK